jgi:hypothetical protein
MKVIVTATSAEKNHTDRLDLYASRSRKAFSANAAWRLELDAEKIEANLLDRFSKVISFMAYECCRRT